MLAQAANERGIHTFTGTYLADNRPVTALINQADEPANQVPRAASPNSPWRFRPPDREP